MPFGRAFRRGFAPTLTVVAWLGLLLSAAPAEEDPRLADCRRHSAAVLRALQSKDLAAALKSLGEAADLAPAIHPRENDGLAAAAGAMHRALMQLSGDERFDLLYAWTMPTDARPAVRILTTLAPQDAPPKEFARALNERPRETSFPVSEIGGVRGLFSTGWTLVVAADEVGRLRRLTTELERLAEQKAPNAETLLMLARVADRRGDVSSVADRLRQRAAALQARLAEPSNVPKPIDPADITLAAAALRREELQPISEEIFKLLEKSAYGSAAPRLRPLLRVAHATAAQLHHGESGPEVLRTNRLKYWAPTSGKTAELHAGGAADAMWLVHEDHILHLAGAGNDVLFLRYPLTGDFDFTCETQVGGEMGTEGGLAYGGLHFEALGSPEQLTVWDADLAHQVTKPCPFVRHEQRPIFNRVSIRSSDEGAVFAANLHPMWFDGAASKTSPWLGLRSFGDRRPLFRNLKITGNPVIPRQVRMSDGNQLRGWQSQFFGETKPPFAPEAQPVATEATAADFDWSIQEGVIQAAKREAPAGATPQSLLRYQRPLLDGESVSYEFYYEPGNYEAHPALGRLAFLIEPSGVRIHWITDGDLEWTGLPADNATLEPLNRRGPRPLPLKEGDWNQVALARADGKATVSLNGELIYDRPIDFGGDHTFGLYRDAAKAAVRVRNVVMTGDWPKSLPEELLDNPAAVVRQAREGADRHALGESVGDEFLAENVRCVRRRAASLAPAERFEFLARWALPGPDHPGFRMSGEFTPADPSPLAASLAPERFPHGSRGGELVSPVFDLLDAAAETNKLHELRSRVEAIPDPHGEAQQRAKAALLLLTSLKLGDIEAVASACEQLQQLVLRADPETAADMWPETLAVERGMQHLHRAAAVGDLLGSLYSHRTQRSFPDGCENWHARIAFLMETRRRLAAGATDEALQASADFDHWVSVQRVSAQPRGDGHPQSIWIREESDEAFHLLGNHEDYLLFRSPLRGDFEVAGEMGVDATTQLYAAGKYFGPRWIHDLLEIGTFRHGGVLEKISPPFAHLDPWIRFRAVFRDRVRTIFLNGRPVHTEELPEHRDPWIGVRAWSRAVARLRNVQIAGEPEIPEATLMSASPQLVGWVPYFDESADGGGAIWRHVAGAEIHGRRRAALDGSHWESLLGYYRPLAEDGTIEYEFYYEPETIEVHPALDRLALLLAPGGVRLHWITDGRYDRTEAPPDNVFDEPQSRRGPAALPLRRGQWNQMQLSIAGGKVSLHLNGQLIFERSLEPNNRRTFGLFRYADRSEVRVRNVVMRGGWPKTLPSAAEMELGDAVAESLDADLPRLKAVFTHDFAKDGLPEKYFQVVNSEGPGAITPREDGVLAIRSGADNWPTSSLRLPFSAEGDFDVEASFQLLKLESDKDAVVMLLANLDDERQRQCRLLRSRHGTSHQRIEPSLSELHPTGGRVYSNDPVACEAGAGTLRIARRGATVYYLFAEERSRAFQCVKTDDLSASPMKLPGIELHALGSGRGETQVLWKSVALRAERLRHMPPDSRPQRALCLMNADGGDLRRLTGPAEGLTHLGSPEWSTDGAQIAFDMSLGSVASSRIAVINADGSGLKDLGPGCMPSFSKDRERIVFSQPGKGVMMMKSNGSDRQVVDAQGWGAQWSPDGKHIAYAKSGNITVMAPDTRRQKTLLMGEQAMRYTFIYWNLGWSHDSRWLAFKGQNRRTRGDEVAIANLGGEFRTLYPTAGEVNADFTWSPDQGRVLFAMQDAASEVSKLFWIDRAAREAPKPFPGQPLDRSIFDCDWSHDGRRIAFSSESLPQPVDWPLMVVSE